MSRISPPPGVPSEAVAATTKKLDVMIGDRVESNGRSYNVVSDKVGGVTLEPAITQTVDEILAEHGGRSLIDDEFDEHFGRQQFDGEG